MQENFGLIFRTLKNPLQNSPGNSVGDIPLGFLQKPFLENKVQICSLNDLVEAPFCKH